MFTNAHTCTGYRVIRMETADGAELVDEKAAPPDTVYVVGAMDRESQQ